MTATEIVSSAETGKLNVKHLKRYWHKSMLKRDGELTQGSFQDEWKTDTTLLSVLRLGLEQTMQYLYLKSPSFDEFENWILKTSGVPDHKKTDEFNRLFSIDKHAKTEVVNRELLSEADWEFWQQNGYLIIRNAVSREDCDQTVKVICDFLEIDRYDAASWYNIHPAKQGIMVQLFQHALLEKNRNAYKIRKAFEEVWNRTDLWLNADRVGFNPPETESYKFPGPKLHWDISINLPYTFGTQGILYLADTAANQGAFTLVPGFQHRIEGWLNSLPPGANPRQENLYALGAKPIAANAGDFILWHHILPHGSSPNTASLPRFVQYINYSPADEKESDVWV
jgi:hypothetical protein